MEQRSYTFNINDYRFGFNGKEAEGEADDHLYDFGARIYDNRIGRFLSMDRFSSKFPYNSPYLISGNNPIAGVDVNGDSLYILMYTTGNSRGDDMFQAAAMTRKKDIEAGANFDPSRDKVVLLQVQDMAKVKGLVSDATKENSKQYGKTVEFGIWSHAGVDGPTGTKKTSADELDTKQMTVTGWGKIDFNWYDDGCQTRAGFYGCNTGKDPSGDKASFVTELSAKSNMSNVTLYGQTSSSFPSKYTNARYNDGREEGDYISPILGEPYLMRSGLDKVPSKLVYPVIGSKLKDNKSVYMVSGVRRSDDWNLNEQNVANKMRVSKNGKGSVGQYQTGTKKTK